MPRLPVKVEDLWSELQMPVVDLMAMRIVVVTDTGLKDPLPALTRAWALYALLLTEPM